jgi:hypothetical protein
VDTFAEIYSTKKTYLIKSKKRMCDRAGCQISSQLKSRLVFALTLSKYFHKYGHYKYIKLVEQETCKIVFEDRERGEIVLVANFRFNRDDRLNRVRFNIDNN